MATKYLAGERIVGTAAERTAMITGLPAWELGTEADDISTNISWSTNGTHNVSYDSNANEIDINPTGNNYGANVGYWVDINSLGSITISDTTWVLRLKWNQSTWIENTGTSGLNSVFVFLTSSTNPSSSHDAVGLGIHNYSTEPQGIRLVSCIGQNANNPIDNSEAVFTPSSGTTYWIEVKRTNATTVECRVYTNSDFSTGQVGSTVTRTVTSSLGGLQYLNLWGLMQTNAGDNYNNVSLRWFKFWNGTTSTTAVYPNLSNGTIFEESDTGTHYMWDGTDTWNEVT